MQGEVWVYCPAVDQGDKDVFGVKSDLCFCLRVVCFSPKVSLICWEMSKSFKCTYMGDSALEMAFYTSLPHIYTWESCSTHELLKSRCHAKCTASSVAF